MQPGASFFLMLISILTTAVCWGTYGPILHWGQGEMGGRLRTFICVGIAYFLVAIVVPIAFMAITRWEMGDEYKITFWGLVWSLLGGALGAVGALGIILAFTYSPFQRPTTPLVVMPLVFGLAPVVNTFFTMYMNRGKELEAMSPFFAAGLILTAVGASSVLVFAPKPAAKPAGTHAKKAVLEEAAASEKAAEVASMTSSSNALANKKLAEEVARAEEAEAAEQGTESKS